MSISQVFRIECDICYKCEYIRTQDERLCGWVHNDDPHGIADAHRHICDECVDRAAAILSYLPRNGSTPFQIVETLMDALNRPYDARRILESSERDPLHPSHMANVVVHFINQPDRDNKLFEIPERSTLHLYVAGLDSKRTTIENLPKT